MFQVLGRDVIFEFKGAYFLPTGSVFKHVYHGSALYGPELTVHLCNEKNWYSNWYGFLSIDYFQKKGFSSGLCDPTKISLLPLGVGLKYFAPMCSSVDFYTGLGFQPIYVRTRTTIDCVEEKLSRWAFGGIAKVGTYVYLPCNFVLDFFIDYSFMKMSCKNKCQASGGIVVPTKANVSGAIFGAGLGYRF